MADLASIRRVIAEVNRRGGIPKEIRICRPMKKSLEAEFKRVGLFKNKTKVRGAELYGLKIVEDPRVPMGEVWIMKNRL